MIDRTRGWRAVALSAAFAAACSTTGVGSSSSQTAAPAPSTGTAVTTRPTPPPAWRANTMEHVDLWLHGFALLTSDTGKVPFFARGYRQQITSAKRVKNIVTQLDANQPSLSARFATNPALTNAQFLAMYFSSFQEIVNATDLFIRADGNPRASNDPQVQQQIALLAATFPQQGDRNWLRLFVQSLQDENTRFFHAYWVAEQQSRGPTYSQFVEEWQSKYYPKLTRFLNNTQQARGQILLSIPLGGEGRTINDGKQSNLVAVPFPTTMDSTTSALFVFAHEVVARLVQEAINDNTTPAQARTGETNAYVGNGAVRGGALLLQRVLPDLAPEYMRYYLRTIGRTPPSGDPSTAFAAAFPVPSAIVNGINSSIGVALGGI